MMLGAAALALVARADAAAEVLKKPLPSVFDPAAIDQSVDPCVDFYQFACGAWMIASPLPADQQIWWRGSELDEHIRAVLATVLREAAAGLGLRTENRRNIGDYYASCLDQAAIDAKGLRPFALELEHIAAIKEKSDLARVVARLHLIGAAPLFRFSSIQDYSNATIMIAVADQDGFALPDRDYYLTGEFKSERAAYRVHLERIFGLLGDGAEQAKAEAKAVMRIETTLAKAAMGLLERRDPHKVHYKMLLGEFVKLTPTFDWSTYLAELGPPAFTWLDVADLGFFQRLEASLKSVSLAAWKSYLRWSLIHGLISAAPSAFVEEDFAFFDNRLGGQAEITPRWKACVDATDRQLGEALGEAYAERAFSPDAKRRVSVMMREIKKAMEANIKALDWMSEETKRRALAKLAAVSHKIGHPDKWLDYSSLEIVRGDVLGNFERASAFALQRELAKIGKPVDRDEWEATPPTNDASYDVQKNDIEIPAGVLQPPNFDLTADAAANYGSLGALLGHELTHGFDDEGRHYDARGNLKDWSTRKDMRAFEARASSFVHEYSAFIAAGDPTNAVHVDGKLTLGENTADNGGLWLAYEALRRTPAASGGKDTHGYTPVQRFFLSYAQGWCATSTEAFAREAAHTDPHAPPKYRVNGVVVNMPAFREAFACKTGAPMAPAKIRRVW
jgi:putative endopeptidase